MEVRKTQIHSETTEQCKHYLADEACPFDTIGCIFLHEPETTMDVSANNDDYELVIEEEVECHFLMRRN